MAFSKKGFILIIFLLLGFCHAYAENLTINESVLNKTKNEIIKNMENKTLGIFRDIKAIEYAYYIYDETKKYDMYKAKPTNIDVSIVSTHGNSSIALAYQPKAFIIYDNVYLKIYNRDKQNLTLNIIINDKIVNNYSVSEQYALFKFEFNENVKKLRIQLISKNNTVFDTGKLTVIHMNFIDWYEEQNKDTVSIEKAYLILSNLWYMLTGGALALVLCLVIARYKKKKKERQIVVGW